MGYATIEDIERSWRSVADYEREHVEQMLDDAALWLDAQVERSGKDPEAFAASHPDVMRFLSCNLVRRACGELHPTGAEAQWSVLTEPTAQAFTPAVVRGDFYLTKWERGLIGAGCGRAGFSPGADG